ncbi:hypothetical protein BZA05DRAFT_434159, partial [Tricharina praecox]|uniref:uncharacterized protein n=1 Tax=Tricharina praecox TaxID=43433 RepID=UPI002220BD14
MEDDDDDGGGGDDDDGIDAYADYAVAVGRHCWCGAWRCWLLVAAAAAGLCCCWSCCSWMLPPQARGGLIATTTDPRQERSGSTVRQCSTADCGVRTMAADCGVRTMASTGHFVSLWTRPSRSSRPSSLATRPPVVGLRPLLFPTLFSVTRWQQQRMRTEPS